MVYTQTKEATLVDNGSKHTFVYVNHVSGKGTPQEVLNQYQEKHRSMMNDGYGSPEIIGHHHFKRNAEDQVARFRLETDHLVVSEHLRPLVTPELRPLGTPEHLRLYNGKFKSVDVECKTFNCVNWMNR